MIVASTKNRLTISTVLSALWLSMAAANDLSSVLTNAVQGLMLPPEATAALSSPSTSPILKALLSPSLPFLPAGAAGVEGLAGLLGVWNPSIASKIKDIKNKPISLPSSAMATLPQLVTPLVAESAATGADDLGSIVGGVAGLGTILGSAINDLPGGTGDGAGKVLKQLRGLGNAISTLASDGGDLLPPLLDVDLLGKITGLKKQQ